MPLRKHLLSPPLLYRSSFCFLSLSVLGMYVCAILFVLLLDPDPSYDHQSIAMRPPAYLSSIYNVLIVNVLLFGGQALPTS
jgi:hypothetical protein